MGTVNAALAVLHIATGTFFVTTGARKCFMSDVRTKVHGLFDRYRVPRPAQWLVMAGEFTGGLGILFGCLTHLAAIGLLVIMAGAYKLDTWPGVKDEQLWNYAHRIPVPRSWSKLLSNALCTPEAQLIVILLALALAGAGSISLDALIFGG